VSRRRSARGETRTGCPEPVSSQLNAQRALYSLAAAVEDVSVDHGRLHVFVAQELLNGSDVVAAFQQVRRKAVVGGMGLRVC